VGEEKATNKSDHFHEKAYSFHVSNRIWVQKSESKLGR
jgi:hypothetical protein